MNWPMDLEHCKQCFHYDEDLEYDYCHMCVMEHNYFKPKQEEKHEEQRRSYERCDE